MIVIAQLKRWKFSLELWAEDARHVRVRLRRPSYAIRRGAPYLRLREKSLEFEFEFEFELFRHNDRERLL
jgi:hypothetical protein